MTTQSVLALFALFVLWINTLLIVGAALQRRRDIGEYGQRLRPLVMPADGVGLVVGTVAGDKPLGRRVIDQVGRQVGRLAESSAGQQVISFHDRGYRSEVTGGTLLVGDAALTVEAPDAAARVAVWVDDATLAAAATADDAQLAAAGSAARKARGYARAVVAELQCGQKVWAFGAVTAGRLTPDPTGELLLSAFDPRAWCRHQQRLLSMFSLGVLTAAAGCTSLALWPPHFGTVSTLGGVLGLAYFLGVQPLAVALHERARLPAVALLRGHWRPGRGHSARVAD